VPGRLLTVTATGDEVAVAPSASVTRSSKLQVPGVARAPVVTEGFEMGVHPTVKELQRATKLFSVGDFSSHWHV
jgi:hypothetical protein